MWFSSIFEWNHDSIVIFYFRQISNSISKVHTSMRIVWDLMELSERIFHFDQLMFGTHNLHSNSIFALEWNSVWWWMSWDLRGILLKFCELIFIIQFRNAHTQTKCQMTLPVQCEIHVRDSCLTDFERQSTDKVIWHSVGVHIKFKGFSCSHCVSVFWLIMCSTYCTLTIRRIRKKIKWGNISISTYNIFYFINMNTIYQNICIWMNVPFYKLSNYFTFTAGWFRFRIKRMKISAYSWTVGTMATFAVHRVIRNREQDKWAS